WSPPALLPPHPSLAVAWGTVGVHSAGLIGRTAPCLPGEGGSQGSSLRPKQPTLKAPGVECSRDRRRRQASVLLRFAGQLPPIGGESKRMLPGIGNGFKSIVQHGRFVVHFGLNERYPYRLGVNQGTA